MQNMKRASVPIAVLILLLAVRLLAAEVQLQRETLEGFSRYVQATEARIEKELAHPDAFLYMDGLPERRRAEVFASLQRGEIYIERLNTLDSGGNEIAVPGGMIHHWLGVVFIPGVTLGQTLELVQDYNHHKDIYEPGIARSRLISRNGDDFKIYYRLRKKKIITVTLNTEHAVHYTRVDSRHAYSRSYSTWIAEVENAGRPDEREKPIGYDSGFLWRVNSYWGFEERDGGVYVEAESISLTRHIPFGLGWLIKPFTNGIPKESLEMTLGSTGSALVARLPGLPKADVAPGLSPATRPRRAGAPP